MAQIIYFCSRYFIRRSYSYHRHNGRKFFPFPTIFCSIKFHSIRTPANLICSKGWFFYSKPKHSRTGTFLRPISFHYILFYCRLLPQDSIYRSLFGICKCVCCNTDANIRPQKLIVLNLYFFVHSIVFFVPFTRKIRCCLIACFKPYSHSIFQTGHIFFSFKDTLPDRNIFRTFNPNITAAFFVSKSHTTHSNTGCMTNKNRRCSIHISHIKNHFPISLNGCIF